MISFEQLEEAATLPEIKELDFSSFSKSDVLKLILQRSEIIRDQNVKKKSPVVLAWLQGDTAPGYALIEKMGDELVHRAAAVIWLEYQEIKSSIGTLAPKSIADIGCGYAFFDLFYWLDFPGRIILIDIEESDDRHFGFAQTGSAYSNLEVARSFLISNGVKASSVNCVNPQKKNLSRMKPVDLAVSFVSCGYHYPLSAYATFFEKQVAQDGSLIVDLRRKKAQQEMEVLKPLGEVSDIAKAANGTARRVLVRKGRLS